MTLPVRPDSSFPRFVLAGVLLAGLAVGCSKPAAPPKPPVAVTVAPSTLGEAPYLVMANGLVEPMQSVAVQSQVGGVLLRVHFREGDEVQAGQLLFTIDPRPYEAALRQAQAVLARDLAQAENARRDSARFAALVQKDYVTRAQADQAAANATALAAVVEAGRAAVASARLDLEYATIRAPIAGKTGALLVREGNLVRPGAVPPLVVINQIRPILVRFSVPEREFPQVQRYATKGALPVRVLHAPNDAKPAPPVAGTLSFLDNEVDTTTGTVTLKGRFANEDRRLWPGQFVRVELELYRESGAVLVPSQAVQTGQDGAFVFVVDAERKAVMKPVTPGRQVGDLTVIEQGLDAGERVVTDGQGKLAPGSKVDVKGGGAP
ncbi:MAG TPA: efflux RND transporter periplasmic adaptor subunit [Gemmatimonadaceae bacterium]|nr:efflux RND transporter periplasmic adaptor subunit [Gemmatimonadaceae bacterium]